MSSSRGSRTFHGPFAVASKYEKFRQHRIHATRKDLCVLGTGGLGWFELWAVVALMCVLCCTLVDEHVLEPPHL